MTRRVHSDAGERTETAKAFASYTAYRDLGPARSIARLHEQFMRQAAASKADGGKTPLPPTTSRQMLEEWCAVHQWVQRVTEWQAQQDAVRQAELRRQIEQQAREDLALVRQTARGAVSVGAVALNALVDETTGLALREMTPRDAALLLKAGTDALLATMGQSASLMPAGMDSVQLEGILRECDDETRKRITDGMRVALEWQVRHGRI